MHPKSFVSNFWGAVQVEAFFVCLCLTCSLTLPTATKTKKPLHDSHRLAAIYYFYY